MILTADDIAVIHERHFGWEQATPALLAAVFGVSVQKITAILRERPHSHPSQNTEGDVSNGARFDHGQER